MTKSKTNYVARWNGVVVGTMSSRNRVRRYTHAIIGQLHEETVRKWAYATPDDDTEYRRVFDYYATGRHKWQKARVADGFDLFAAQWRERRIEWFEDVRANYGWCFDVRVLRWLMPGEAAREPRVNRSALDVFFNVWDKRPEMAHEGHTFGHDWTEIVPVETEMTAPVIERFMKLSGKAQRELLGFVADKMIERKAWPEISGLLATYLEGDAPLIMKLMGGTR